MDDQDALMLIEMLQKRLRLLGEAELANQDLYIEDHPERGRRRLQPRERLAQMVEAFERAIALDDESTRRQAINQMAEATDGDVPRVRVVPYNDDVGRSGDAFYFDHLRDLSDIRAKLSKLAALIRSGDVTRGGAEEPGR